LRRGRRLRGAPAAGIVLGLGMVHNYINLTL
jgi:hypothetical protein